ncbi:MAG: 30S ribosomal protein S1 [Microgenomates bacterium OLB22]|nr:MAG: 30S ribosomal protein S1 [Microgenomates bacterium OLB22]
MPTKQSSATKKVKTSTPRTMEDLLHASHITPPRKGTECEATIVQISRRGILFDIGWKSYAVLGDLEIQEIGPFLSHLKEGEKVVARIVVEESKEGYPVVSMRRFFDKGRWDILQEKFESEEVMEVLAGDYGKGGIFIDFMGIRGVIPKIQLTTDYIDNPEKLSGQKIKVKILEVDKIKNRLVVSQKAAALGISYKDIQKRFDAIEIGKTYKATVIGFSEFGVFCELDKIEGLIHISEISWQKVNDPQKHVAVGSVIDVVVVEKNAVNLKLNLSIKRLSKDPWEDLEKKYPKDKEIKAEVIRKESYGYIVRLEEGIEGLIHISKLTGNERIEIGKPISVYIEKIDSKSRRISLLLLPTEKPLIYR